ncbi:MAG: hypothetical protein R3Y29_05915 [bacterium]
MVDLNKTDYHIYNKNVENNKNNAYLLKNIPTGDTFRRFSDYLIIDFITTNNCVSSGHILAIHSIKINNNIVVDEFYSLVNNKSSIPEYICKKYCLNINEIKKSKDIKEVKKEFLRFINNNSHDDMCDVNIIIKDNYNKTDFLLYNLSSSEISFNIVDLSYTIKSNKRIYREASVNNIKTIETKPNKLIKRNYSLYFAYSLYKQL